MTLEPRRAHTPRPSRIADWMPLLWLVAACALAVVALMFAPVPPL